MWILPTTCSSPAPCPESLENCHPKVLGSLGLRLLPQHRTLWAKFNPSTYKVRISSATSSLSQHPAKGHTRCSLPSSCCHQGGGKESSVISSVCHVPALHTASLLVCDPRTPAQHVARFVTMARHPRHPPHREARGKLFSSSSIRAWMDTAPRPGPVELLGQTHLPG